MSIKIDSNHERVVSRIPARILIYKDNELTIKITAKMNWKQNAPYITFCEEKIRNHETIKVKIESEDRSALIFIYENNQLIKKISAEIRWREDYIDDRYYDTIMLYDCN